MAGARGVEPLSLAFWRRLRCQIAPHSREVFTASQVRATTWWQTGVNGPSTSSDPGATRTSRPRLRISRTSN